MQRILVLNPKGGSGKTTIATNLASYFASQGDRPLLQDNDPQGSSSRWLKKRKPDQAFIHGVASFERNSRMTRAWQMRIPPDAGHVIVDTPAAVPPQELPDMTKNADAIIVPVLPSDIDIHARDVMETKTRLNAILAKHTGQTVERVKADSDRDNFMTAEQARSYGLIDSMIEKRGEIPAKA